MTKSLRNLITLILVAICLFSIGQLIHQRQDQKRQTQIYEDAIVLAQAAEVNPTEAPVTEATEPPAPTETQPPEIQWIPAPLEEADENMDKLAAIDLNALRQTNPDVVGWIYIPNSRINYPLMQGEDNTFYLERTWEGSLNAYGSIFLESRNSPDFTDFNTIIYGHNMRNGTMFSSLRSYAVPGYWEKHPYFYIRSDAGVARYDIFAIQSVSTDSIIYGLGIDTTQRKQQFLRFAADYSLVDTGLMPTTDDSIVTLSTCTGNGHAHRWVVIGMLNEEASYLPGR